ncbi:hypothetical protein ABZX85_01570 [Streptomyces sp. NPDC004539]|uniref:hypothetical protein n=1 Tax=Streptomyces sp. NPDC004539 TaxID=3154280 RepID=UPI0033AC8438
MAPSAAPAVSRRPVVTARWPQDTSTPAPTLASTPAASRNAPSQTPSTPAAPRGTSGRTPAQHTAVPRTTPAHNPHTPPTSRHASTPTPSLNTPTPSPRSETGSPASYVQRAPSVQHAVSTSAPVQRVPLVRPAPPRQEPAPRIVAARPVPAVAPQVEQGAVVSGPPAVPVVARAVAEGGPAVQRAPKGAKGAPAKTADAVKKPVQQAGGTGKAAGRAVGREKDDGLADSDLDDLARRLLDPVARLLRTELRRGRDRTGRPHDGRR